MRRQSLCARSTARVSRGRLNTVLALYDFPDPMMTAPQRDLTTSPLQQLFVMNSPFMQERAADLVKRVESGRRRRCSHVQQIRDMYRAALDRDPTPKELDLALTLSGEGNAGAVRAGAAGIQRGDFLAMNLT